jgi:hypothetical protein
MGKGPWAADAVDRSRGADVPAAVPLRDPNVVAVAGGAANTWWLEVD